ncbi:hypothetical protein HU200_061152 [Digitaria exilis]|uniref:Uncharacterized protein n=1 Tax=Digitaria exilis TaxID=1010633 RepID=A0A835AFA9_9POAL|nr:hypothetical protein HU200_061152 [Digitaria exilis]
MAATRRRGGLPGPLLDGPSGRLTQLESPRSRPTPIASRIHDSHARRLARPPPPPSNQRQRRRRAAAFSPSPSPPYTSHARAFLSVVATTDRPPPGMPDPRLFLLLLCGTGRAGQQQPLHVASRNLNMDPQFLRMRSVMQRNM